MNQARTRIEEACAFGDAASARVGSEATRRRPTVRARRYDDDLTGAERSAAAAGPAHMLVR